MSKIKKNQRILYSISLTHQTKETVNQSFISLEIYKKFENPCDNVNSMT